MIYECRTYEAKPGRLGSWLRAYEETRLPILEHHLGNLVGAFTPDTGTLNQLVQIWAYEDFEDRARRRSSLWNDPDWINPANNTAKALQRQHSVILLPTRFSPLK